MAALKVEDIFIASRAEFNAAAGLQPEALLYAVKTEGGGIADEVRSYLLTVLVPGGGCYWAIHGHGGDCPSQY
jgi:hypothetical protein